MSVGLKQEWSWQAVARCSSPLMLMFFVLPINANPLIFYSWSSIATYNLLCISTSECMLAHAFGWLKTIKNALKFIKNILFFTFLCKPYMSLSYALWKSKFFNNFRAFLSFSIIRTHAQASMHTLVEIHNNYCYKITLLKGWHLFNLFLSLNT